MKYVNTGLVASGSGTDANAIMAACASGKIDNAKVVILISTKAGVGCLDKAENHGVTNMVIERKGRKLADFTQEIYKVVGQMKVELLFFVGNVVVFTPPPGVLTLNIHPADKKKHGGKTMYGLAVPKHVLSEIRDEIRRGWKTVWDRFFTTVTVHEVNEKPDQGAEFCTLKVEIPKSIIMSLMAGKTKIGRLAARLQKHVLPYEWKLLPVAVEAAAAKILNGEVPELHNFPPDHCSHFNFVSGKPETIIPR